jgi:microcystin-dependent protein
MNSSLRQLDTAYGGMLSLSVSGGTTVLTTAQASNPVINLTGTLSSNQVIAFPSTVSGRRIIIPNVGMGNFALYVRGNNGNDGVGVFFWIGFGIPYGIVVTPGRVYWDYGAVDVGTIVDKPTGFAGNGWLPCDGRYVDQGQFDLLYDVIGGTWGISGGAFKLPDYRGTVTAMADQIGTVPGAGPYAINAGTRGILYGWGLTTFAGEANHVLSAAEMPSHNHTDSGHAHSVYDPGHQHLVSNIALGGGVNIQPGSGFNQTGTVATDIRAANITVNAAAANITYAGGSGAHNNIQPTTCTMKMIKW